MAKQQDNDNDNDNANENNLNLYNPRPKTIVFEGFTNNDETPFRPNLTPSQILRAGAFGGTYFRQIKSGVTGKTYSYKKAIKEYPKSWFKGLDIEKQVARPYNEYDINANKYKKKVGLTLKQWETNKWITATDPYGWFQWYCRFYMGRRLGDEDLYQIGRFNGMSRFIGSLVTMIKNKEKDTGQSHWNDPSVGTGYRQTLLHWGYQLTLKDYNRFKSDKNDKGYKIR